MGTLTVNSRLPHGQGISCWRVSKCTCWSQGSHSGHWAIKR